MNELPKQGRVVVRGPDIRKPPLLDSSEPAMIEVYDSFGDPMALLVRIMSDDTWGFCTKGDPDWEAMLLRFGLIKLAPGTTFKALLTQGIAPFVERK